MITICIHHHNKIDWNLVFNGITAIGTLGALAFAVIIARNISFKKDLRKKQLDAVFELVGYLQDLQFYFSFRLDQLDNGNIIASHSGDTYYPFFDMTKEKFQSIDAFANSDATIFVSEKFLYENPIFKYVKNPFLPQSIALKLINLYPRGGDQFQYAVNQNQVYISDDRDYGGHTYRQEISQYYLSLSKLFETTEALNKSIKAWLKTNGADDLNFRDKLINMQNYP
jgi:hypothetical protein